MKRKYVRYSDVYEQLKAYCRICSGNGILLLPSERTLAEHFSVSLMTMRKAVSQALMEQIIIRSGKHTTIAPDVCLEKLGKILFVTGNARLEMLPALERLWLMLKPQVEKFGGCIEILPDLPMEQFKERCSQADLILLALFPYNTKFTEKQNYLQSLQKTKRVIALSDPQIDSFENAVALDNYAVGKIAGKALSGAGCKKALVLGVVDGELMFQKRFKGFVDGFQGEYFRVPRPADNLLEDPIPKEIQALSKAVKQGFDCAFIATDEDTPRITAQIIRKGLVPNKFRIITVRGSGECYKCLKPLANVSHATGAVTSSLIEVLKKISRGEEMSPKRVLITPNFHKEESF